MKLKILLRAGGGAAVCLAITPACAQSTPENPIQTYIDAEYEKLPNSGDADIDLSVFQANNAPAFYEEVYHVDGPAIELPHLSGEALRNRSGFATIDGSGSQLVAVTNVNGALVHARYAGQTSVAPGGGATTQGTFAVSLFCKSSFSPDDPLGYQIAPTGVTRTQSDIYGVFFTGGGYEAGYGAYRRYLRDDDAPSGYTGTARPSSREFRESVYECGVRGDPANPLVGTAQSLQFQTVDDALDFTQPTVGEGDSSWGIGGRIGQVQRGSARGFQFDARINRSFRLSEGDRALLTIDVPLSYQQVGGDRQLRGYAAVSGLLPLNRIWSVSPRLSYGVAGSFDQELVGQLLSVSITNTLFFDNLVGRGALTLGSLVGATKVTNVRFVGKSIGAGARNFPFRNGFAYEYPLKMRVLQRAASMRGNYAFTVYAGDTLFANKIHELSTSVGARSRGADIRNGFEVLRVGVISRLARQSNSAHLFVGYRF